MADRGRTSAGGHSLPRRLAAAPNRGFVGRASELEALGAILRDIEAGNGPRVVLISGEQGAGKTTLAAEAARVAAGRGWAVSYGRAEEALEVPFGPWRQALGPAWPEEQYERDELFAEVLDHVTATADPVLLVLDDLQWADQASLLLVGHAVVAGAGPRLGLVLAYRSTESEPASPLGALLGTLGREPGVVRVPVAGLAREDVEALIACDQELTGADAHRVWADTRGNAFFVNALLDELKAASDVAPSTLRDVIGYRVARLGGDARPVLEAASVVGEVFAAPTLASVTGLPEARVLDVIESAMADGLVTEAPIGGFSFVHALVPDTLTTGFSGPRRRALHRAAADALAAQNADAAAVAHHLAAARPDDRAGQERTVDAAIEAASTAIDHLAYEDAVERLTDAMAMIERWRLDEHRRCTALLVLTRAQQLAGRADDAVPTAARAIDLAVALARWDDVITSLYYFPKTASTAPDPALLTALEHAANAAPATTPIRALVMASLAWVLHFTDDQARGRLLAEEAVTLADEHGDRAARAYTRTMLLLARGGDPNPAAQLELVRTVEALLQPDDDWAVRGTYELRLRRVYELLRMGEIDEVDKEVQRVVALDRRRGHSRQRWWVLNLQAVQAILEGRLAEAEALSAAAEASIATHGFRAKASARLAHTVSIAYLKGEFGRYRDTLSAFAHDFPLAALRSILCSALASAGRDTEARELLGEFTRDGAAALPRDDAFTSAAFFLADACRLLDARPEATELYGVLVPYAGEHVVTSSASAACFGAVDRALGQLAIVCAWEDRARRHLEDAVRLNARIGARPFLALARVEQAALGVPGAAEEARAVANELGIDLVLQRLERYGVEQPPADAATAELRCEGDVWRVSYGGHTARLKNVRGLHYLRALLARPGQEVHAAELQGSASETGTPLLDATAKQAYRRRLVDIEAELEEAEAFGDGERAARAAAERLALAEELAGAVGLGGRDRTVGSSSERARLNVSRAIRSAVDRIAEVNPELGRHLQLAVRTGTFCAYEPDPALSVSWSV